MQRKSDKIAGGVATSLVVPDFDRDLLSVSGIVLGRLPDAALKRGEPLADMLPFAPTTRRAFAPAEMVTALVRVYQGGNKSVRPAMLRVTIADERDMALVDTTKELPATAFVGETRVADYQLRLPLSQLVPGEYLLTMGATLGNSEVQARPVRFAVKR
jgi:hypothetical protein